MEFRIWKDKVKKGSRDFAIRELHYHEKLGHLIRFEDMGGFICLTCHGLGCVGEDVGDLTKCGELQLKDKQ